MALERRSHEREPIRDVLEDVLFPWQLEVVDAIQRARHEDKPYTIVKKPRQSGASEAAGWLAALQAYLVPDHKVFCVSQRQKASIAQYIRRIKSRILPVLRAWHPEFFNKVEVTKSRIEFPNGSSILAESSNLEGMRGETRSSIICDEVAKWPRQAQKAFRAAIMPILESGANEHGILVVISTPRQKEDNLYSELWHDKSQYGPHTGWHRIAYDVHDLIEAEALGWTQDKWDALVEHTSDTSYLDREYRGIFSASSISYYPDVDDLSYEDPLDGLSEERRANLVWYGGIDVGGVQDPTCAILVAHDDEDDSYIAMAPLYIWSKDFRNQCRQLASYFDVDDIQIKRIVVDASAHQTFPTLFEEYVDGIRIKGQAFTRTWKVEQSELLYDLIDQARIRLSFDASTVSEGRTRAEPYLMQGDLAAVRQVFTSSGNVTYKAERSEGRHSDGWSALLCALDASTSGSTWFSVNPNDL